MEIPDKIKKIKTKSKNTDHLYNVQTQKWQNPPKKNTWYLNKKYFPKNYQ